METQMESFKKKARLSRRFSSRRGLGSLKTRFKRFLSDHHVDAGETQGTHSASSDSETDERKASSPTPDRSGEIKKSLSSGSSSYSDEGSPSKTKDKEKSDSSSDSSEKKRKMEPSKKSSEKRLQVHLQEERQEVFRLPPLEETPPSSPRSNPRFSTGAQSDYGRLSTHTSAPNSPANLSHNFNLNYRGGDSSPVALIHSLSAKESGKHASQLSEISFASPPSSSSLDLDAPGDKVDEFKASPSKTSPSLKPDVLPIVHHDEEQGVWRCGTCGWIYPNPNPSLRNRREHKKYCGEITNVQRWLGAQDIHDTPDEGASKLEESEVSEGSGLQEKLSAGDEHPMAKSEREDNHEGVSDMSTEPHGAVDQGRLDEIESPDQHAVGGVGNDERNSNAVVDSNEVDDQMKVDKVLEWPTPDTEISDPSISGERLSKKSISDEGVEDQSKLEDVSNGSTGHLEIEKVNKLDDLVDIGLDVSDPTRWASNVAPEVQNEEEEEEPVATEDNLEEVIDDAKSPKMFGSQVEAHENQPNQTALEEMENEVGDVEVPPVKCNGKLEESGQHSLSAVHSDGHDLVHVDNTEGVQEEDASASQDCTEHLNHPHGNGLTEVPEVRTELSVLTSANRIEGGSGIEVSESLRNEEAGTVNEIEKMEPRTTADNGKPIGEAHVQESKATEPSVSTADLQSGKEHADDKIGRMVEHEGVGKGREKGSDKGLGTPNGLLGTEKDVKCNGHEFPEHSNQHRATETDSAKGNSSQVSPAQRNGIATETKGRSAESPSPLEEPSKWVNTGSFTSPEDGDSFSSMQKYWADVTSSKFLLVEGKRSPSFGGSSEVGFPSFRNGDGRRSPSPFSLSKSEHDEAQSQSSIDSANYRSTVEDKDEDRAIPSEEGRRSRSSLSPTKSDHGEIQSQSSVDSVSYRSTGEDKNEDRAIPNGEGRGSPSLSKSGHGEIQSQSAVDSVEDTGEGRAIASGAAIEQYGSSSSTSHVVYDLEKVVEEQNTHDLICPVCRSDVTKRIILRKRKRPPVPDEVIIGPGDAGQDQMSQEDDNDDKMWGCLACLSFFIRRDNGETEAVAPPSSIYGEQERFRCLPKLFPWGPGTSKPELQQPLLGATGREEGPGEVPQRIQEAPSDDDEQVSCFSYLQRFQVQPPAVDTTLPEGSESLNVKAEEKGSYNCLPDLHPFSWGPIPVYTHPPLDMDESPGMEGHKEANAFSVAGSSASIPAEGFHPVTSPGTEESSDFLPPSMPAFSCGSSSRYDLPSSPGILSPQQEITTVPEGDEAPSQHLTGGPQRPEDDEEKKSGNCLSELLPAFSWGPAPVYAPLDTDESPGMTQGMEGGEEKRSCNCLPELLPAFSWGPAPGYTRLDTDESPGMEGQKEATAGSATAAFAEEPQVVDDAKEHGSFNCLPELLPTFSWGAIPVYTHPPLDTDATTESQPQPPGNEVLGEDDGALPDLNGQHVVDGNYSSPGTSTEKSGDSLRPGEPPTHTSSHVATESKDMASCLCIPFELQEIRWGFKKRTTHDNDLHEPLISGRVDGDIEPPAAGPVLLDDSSLIDSEQTAGLPGLAEGSQAPPAGPGTTVDSALSAVEYSPFRIDLSEGTHEDFHFEGTVTSHQTVMKPELNGGPPEVHVHESIHQFNVDIQDGHFTSSIQQLQPKPSQTLGEITDHDVDSYTHSSDPPANGSLESIAKDRPGDIGAETSGDHIVQHPRAPSNELVKENQAASSGTVPEPVLNIIRENFPADPIQGESEVQETAREESKLGNDYCLCLPLSLPTVRWWGPSRGLEEGLEDDLLNNQGAANASDVQIQPTLTGHESAVAAADERCNCLPALPKFSLYHVFRDHHLSPGLQQPGAKVDDIRTPLLGRQPPKPGTGIHIEETTHTSITVDGSASEGAAALVAIADAQRQIRSQGESTSQEYLKSVVHGGLDVTLVSLGVVASAAGGDAKTMTVIAIGLANLVFGIVTHFSNVMSLFYNNRAKFLDEVGQGFVHGCLSNLSFLFFGALAPVTYGFAFQNATNRYYKMAATIVVALVSIVLLGAANAQVQSKSAVRVISLLVVTGFVAAVGGYETGHFVSEVLEYFGFSSV